MDDFGNVIKRDLKVEMKINNVIDRYKRLPYNYQSKVRYDIPNTICRYSYKCMYISSINRNIIV